MLIKITAIVSCFSNSEIFHEIYLCVGGVWRKEETWWGWIGRAEAKRGRREKTERGREGAYHYILELFALVSNHILHETTPCMMTIINF